MATSVHNHIEQTPGVCGGRPRIAGHRIRVQDVAIEHETWGRCPEEIAHNYPGITLADVYAALAYYHDHRDEIRRQIEADRTYVDEFRRQNPEMVLPFDLDGNHA